MTTPLLGANTASLRSVSSVGSNLSIASFHSINSLASATSSLASNASVASSHLSLSSNASIASSVSSDVFDVQNAWRQIPIANEVDNTTDIIFVEQNESLPPYVSSPSADLRNAPPPLYNPERFIPIKSIGYNPLIRQNRP